MADVVIPNCEQPDELVQLLWNTGLDRKAIIREGADAARLLTAQRDEMKSLFWPVPLPLEAVDRWSGNSTPASDVNQPLRPFASAVIPGCVLGALISHFVVAPRLSEDRGVFALLFILVATVALLGVVFKLFIDAVLRRQVAQLDDERALAIVLEQLRRGMAGRSALVPYAVKAMRDGLTAFAAVQKAK